jgi:hypothetical protein
MYLLRSKGQALKVRDGLSGEMKSVGPRAWVEFGALPAGMAVEDGYDIRVRVVECDEDLAQARAENQRMAKEDGMRFDAPVLTPVVAVEPVPMEIEITPSPVKRGKRR